LNLWLDFHKVVLVESKFGFGICKLGDDVGLCLLVRDWVLVDEVVSIGRIQWLDFLSCLHGYVDFELVLGFGVWLGESGMKSWSVPLVKYGPIWMGVFGGSQIWFLVSNLMMWLLIMWRF